MMDGEIFHNHYSGVIVREGTFNMYGGEISGNSAFNGGGVQLINNAIYRTCSGSS